MLKLPPKPAPWLRAVMPIALALNLIGCATRRRSPWRCARRIRRRLRSASRCRETYSASAQQRIRPGGNR